MTYKGSLAPDGAVPEPDFLLRFAATLERISLHPSPTAGWTRDDAIKVLRVIAKEVGSILDSAERLDAETIMIVEHPVTQLLRELADALDVLKYGKIDPRLIPTKGCGGNFYSMIEHDRRLIATNAVEIYKKHKGGTIKEAQSEVARIFKDKFLVADQPVTETKLKSWRRMPPKVHLRKHSK